MKGFRKGRYLGAVATALLAALGATTGLASTATAATPAIKIVDYKVPTNNPSLNRITKGPDGNLWFTEGGANKIGRMTPNGHFTEFKIPTKFSNPVDITTGPDGALWFTEFIGKIGRITVSGHITEYTVNGADGGLFGITKGPNHALYFVANCCGRPDGAIGRITTTGRVTLFPALAGTSPAVGLTTGPDGNIWFTAVNVPCPDPTAVCGDRYAGSIERMTPDGVVNGNFAIPTPYSDPSRIIVGPDGNLWFTEQGAVGGHLSPGQIGRITPDGFITEFTTPTPFSNPAGITVGGDGNLWFTEYSYKNADGTTHGGNNVGRITPQGQITEFPLPMKFARADGITTGPNGDVYFVERPHDTGGFIGRVFV